MAAAVTLQARLPVLIAEDSAVDFVVVGDLNENQSALIGEQYSVALGIAGGEATATPVIKIAPHHTSRAMGLYHPWVELSAETRGSSVFRGVWQTTDHYLWQRGQRLNRRRHLAYGV